MRKISEIIKNGENAIFPEYCDSAAMHQKNRMAAAFFEVRRKNKF